jgi:hypothetical protein
MKPIALLIACATLFIACGESERIPECTYNIFPAGGQQVSAGETIYFAWHPSVGASVYDLYLGSGDETPQLIASNLKELTYAFDVPEGTGLTYRWYVKPKNSDGDCEWCERRATRFSTAERPEVVTEQKVVKVKVLCYDPMVQSGTASVKLHTFFNWADPAQLAQQYIDNATYASHGIIQYEIVDWLELNEFPIKADGFRYTQQSYMECWKQRDKCHSPDDLGYMQIIDEHDIAEGINAGEFEEVWIFGAPYFGFWESAMAGTGAFYINGGIFPMVNSKAFALMGFSYERGPAEMIHNLCHRTEATMSLVYGGWKAEVLNTSWAKFAANQQQSGTAAVGTCHYPPNAVTDYDYCNDQTVSSSADDWYNYPLLTGQYRLVNSADWLDGMHDCQQGYLLWWFHHLPNREGIAPDGKLNCWWRYVYEFNNYIL